MKTKDQYQEDMDRELIQYAMAFGSGDREAAAKHYDLFFAAKAKHDELCEGEG